jgi:hypothetical protein
MKIKLEFEESCDDMGFVSFQPGELDAALGYQPEDGEQIELAIGSRVLPVTFCVPGNGDCFGSFENINVFEQIVNDLFQRPLKDHEEFDVEASIAVYCDLQSDADDGRTITWRCINCNRTLAVLGDFCPPERVCTGPATNEKAKRIVGRITGA